MWAIIINDVYFGFFKDNVSDYGSMLSPTMLLRFNRFHMITINVWLRLYILFYI